MKRIRAVGILLVIAVAALVCFAVPKYKFSKDYEVPHGLTPEQTIEKYFEYIDGNSPKQANLISLNPNFSAFSFNLHFSLKDFLRSISVMKLEIFDKVASE